MKKEMTTSELKKNLAKLERKELESILCGLYKQCDDVEQRLNIQFLGEPYEYKVLTANKEKLHNIFFPNNIRRSAFSLPIAKKVITDFKRTCQNSEMLTELKLYFVECGVTYTNLYGDIDQRYYDAVVKLYCDVIEEVSDDHTLFDKLQDRLLNIVHESKGIGWGFHDNLKESYSCIPWIL